jgi:hypothetical protein
MVSFVCNARKSDGRGNPPGCPISGGSASRPSLLQRFTPLDTFQKGGSLRISGASSLYPQRAASYLTGQGCRAIPLRAGQMDFLRDHQKWPRRINGPVFPEKPARDSDTFPHRNKPLDPKNLESSWEESENPRFSAPPTSKVALKGHPLPSPLPVPKFIFSIP